jgi:hypothetical protein
MASRCKWAKNSIAVAATCRQALYLHMPVVARAVIAVVEINQLFRTAGLSRCEKEQFNTVGTGCCHREIHTMGGDAAAKRPGFASPDRAQRSTPRRQVKPSK